MGVTKYLWDDETDTVVMEKDGAGSVTAEYTHAPARYGRLLSQHRDGDSRGPKSLSDRKRCPRLIFDNQNRPAKCRD